MPEQACSKVPVGVAVELVGEVRQVDVEREGVEGEGPVRHAQRGRRRAHRDARHGVPEDGKIVQRREQESVSRAGGLCGQNTSSILDKLSEMAHYRRF